MNRIDRLSAILVMLQSYREISPQQIMHRFDIGVRTMYRDIRALEEAGIPLTGNAKTGYSLVAGYTLPPLMFTEKEAFAFLAAEKIVDRFSDPGLMKQYRSGMDKIRSVMQATEKEQTSSMEHTIGSMHFHAPQTTALENMLHLLTDSVIKQKQLVLNYCPHGKNEAGERRIDPIGIFFSLSHWYCIGFCHERKDYRTFKLNRISRIERTTIDIDRQHPPLDRFLQDLNKKVGLMEVVIEMRQEDLALMDESRYYQGLTRIEQVEKNEIELRFSVFSLERFARWYLSYADIARIKKPQALQEIIRKSLRLIEINTGRIPGSE